MRLLYHSWLAPSDSASAISPSRFAFYLKMSVMDVFKPQSNLKKVPSGLKAQRSRSSWRSADLSMN